MQLPPISGDVTELTIEASHESYDPLDEVLALFRANTFFRNFEIKGPADRVLIYGILYVSEVLSKIKANMGKRDAEKVRVCFARFARFACLLAWVSKNAVTSVGGVEAWKQRGSRDVTRH